MVSSAITESPNWVEMPHEVMANIFQRLDTLEILNSVPKVSTTWWKICKDLAIWNVINVDGWDARYTMNDLSRLTKQAVDLSCGELTDITLGCFLTYDLLDHIVLSSSKLKHLGLSCCLNITGSGFSRAIRRLTQLEELCISLKSVNIEDIEVIGRNCPQLKSFKMDTILSRPFQNLDDHAVAIANNMPELRHLQIYCGKMTNDGFQAILNGCPHLESLHIHTWYKFIPNRNLVQMCMERVKDFKNNSTSKYL